MLVIISKVNTAHTCECGHVFAVPVSLSVFLHSDFQYTQVHVCCGEALIC